MIKTHAAFFFEPPSCPAAGVGPMRACAFLILRLISFLIYFALWTAISNRSERNFLPKKINLNHFREPSNPIGSVNFCSILETAKTDVCIELIHNNLFSARKLIATNYVIKCILKHGYKVVRRLHLKPRNLWTSGYDINESGESMPLIIHDQTK